MRIQIQMCGIFGAILLMTGSNVVAGIETFTDKDEFLAATGAFATESLENRGLIPGGRNARYLRAPLTFSITAPSTELWVGKGDDSRWTDYIDGHAIAISDSENLNLESAMAVVAVGFEFVEPTTGTGCSSQCPCSESTFTVTLLRGEAVVSAFEYAADNDQLAFVGVRSTEPFDRIEIREDTRRCDNEYFGQFYVLRQCRPDLDDSGDVGFADLLLLLGGWGPCANCPEDLEGDGDVGFEDLIELLSAWGQCPP